MWAALSCVPGPKTSAPAAMSFGSGLAVSCSRFTTPSPGSRVLAEIGEDHIHDRMQAAVAASNGPTEYKDKSTEHGPRE